MQIVAFNLHNVDPSVLVVFSTFFNKSHVYIRLSFMLLNDSQIHSEKVPFHLDFIVVSVELK